MSASNDLEGKLLDHVFGLGAYSTLATVYIALYTADPGEAGSANTNEVSGTDYARVAVTNDATSWSRTGNEISNDNALTFPTAGAGGWGTVTYFGIVQSSSGAGNILFSGQLTASKAVAEGDTFSFPAGDLTVTAD